NFSYLKNFRLNKQLDCYLTHTSAEVHDLLREGFDRSPMFNGSIQSIGPRYCPSIEDKINRFAEKDSHQIFVEPEGWKTVEVYVNGFSTSLPEDVQYKALRSVAGFENVKFFRPGYAIEYDYFPPTQLKNSLETKLINGLFFAGQINGTTGYEEAASQGLIAGLNAALQIKNQDPLVLRRDEAYIGVLIDDLITKGTEEPYRMFTSRAEYRTLLRQDNADLRLTERSYNLGLAKESRRTALDRKIAQTKQIVEFLNNESYDFNEANKLLTKVSSTPVKQHDKLKKLLSRPELNLENLQELPNVQDFFVKHDFDADSCEQAEIQVKYAGYIEKEKNNADKLTRLEYVKIPDSVDYFKMTSISFEAREKLNKIKPSTVSQASRISGVSPSDISVLLIHLGR
ncbi:MAG: tRNA uridine-5-carboxymethylaminomethyl(34) synthesis enzyme MnmG, partial [Flavobacteriaceae bacterium]